MPFPVDRETEHDPKAPALKVRVVERATDSCNSTQRGQVPMEAEPSPFANPTWDACFSSADRSSQKVLDAGLIPKEEVSDPPQDAPPGTD